MSYCRWSSDNWKSDVYCYANVSGAWTTHVAGMRVVGDIPQVDWGLWHSDPDKMWEQYEAQHKFLEDCKRAPIGLPQDGETFDDAGPPEMLERLLWLRGLGYNVPETALEELREEIAGAKAA